MRFVLSAICLILASIALGYGSVPSCDEMSLLSTADVPAPPVDDSTDSAWLGGAMPFDDDDDGNGVESIVCATPSKTASLPRSREVVASPATAACGLGPAPGFAELHERPPRLARG